MYWCITDCFLLQLGVAGNMGKFYRTYYYLKTETIAFLVKILIQAFYILYSPVVSMKSRAVVTFYLCTIFHLILPLIFRNAKVVQYTVFTMGFLAPTLFIQLWVTVKQRNRNASNNINFYPYHWKFHLILICERFSIQSREWWRF